LKVLLTGAFGNVGLSTLKELLKRDHEVSVFELNNRRNRKIAKNFKAKIQIFWGDLRNKEDVEKVIMGQELVIHLAAIIPPLADKKPDLAESVNVEGTINILNAMKKSPSKPKLIFTSSIAVYGDRRHDPMIKLTDILNPSKGDFYAITKITAENLIKQSGINYAIFRLTYITSIDKLEMDPLMFHMPLDTCIEICDTKDVGLALVNAIECEDVWDETYNIGGGKSCRTTYREYINEMMEIFGLGRNFLPEQAYEDKDFHCGFMDTEKSQRLLQYQNHTLQDYYNDVKKKIGSKKYFMYLIKRFVRISLLKRSESYRRLKFFKRKAGAFTITENKFIRRIISKNYKNIDYLENKISELEVIIQSLHTKVKELENLSQI